MGVYSDNLNPRQVTVLISDALVRKAAIQCCNEYIFFFFPSFFFLPFYFSFFFKIRISRSEKSLALYYIL